MQQASRNKLPSKPILILVDNFVPIELRELMEHNDSKSQLIKVRDFFPEFSSDLTYKEYSDCFESIFYNFPLPQTIVSYGAHLPYLIHHFCHKDHAIKKLICFDSPAINFLKHQNDQFLNMYQELNFFKFDVQLFYKNLREEDLRDYKHNLGPESIFKTTQMKGMIHEL